MSESSTLSVRSWRSRRPRSPPSAMRTAISRCRPAARASSRLATLAQAMSRTKTTAPSSSIKAGRRSPTNAASSGSTVMLCRAFELGCGLRELLGDPHHVRAGGLHGDARLQAPDHVDARVVAAVVLAADAVLQPQQRRVDVDGPPAPVEGAGHHADHGEALAAQRERLAQDLRITPEAPLPEALAQERDAFCARLVLLRAEGPSEEGLLAQGGEQARGDLAPVDPLRVRALRGEDEVGPVVADQRLEDAVLVPHVLQVGDGEAHARDLLRPLGQEHQPLGLRVGQRPQQDRVDHAEDGGVGADAQGQGEDGHRREAPGLGQDPDGVFDVAPEAFHGQWDAGAGAGV